MRFSLLPMTAILLLAIGTTGCTHTQLQKNTVSQVQTISDIYHQQVLDNVAMFCADSASLPHFAVVGGGTTQVSDSAAGSFGLGWNATTLTSQMLGLNGNRGIAENWSTAPVTDPDKLRQMRAVYRYALHGEMSDSIEQYKHLLMPGGWFEASCEPQGEDCCIPSGQYCGTYIAVCPGYKEQLTQLTLVILDIATSDAASVPTKEVTRKYDADNNEIERTETVIEVLQNKSTGRKEFYVPQGGQGLQFVPAR